MIDVLGYSGYPVQWQPGQPGQDPVSQQYLYSHQVTALTLRCYMHTSAVTRLQCCLLHSSSQSHNSHQKPLASCCPTSWQKLSNYACMPMTTLQKFHSKASFQLLPSGALMRVLESCLWCLQRLKNMPIVCWQLFSSRIFFGLLMLLRCNCPHP